MDIRVSPIETGLYYLKARYYDPEIGRFISPDDTSYLKPAVLNSLSLYAYCGSDPVMFVDRSGKFPVIVIIAALLFTPLGGTAAQIATSIASYVGMSIWAIGDLTFNDGNGAWNDMNKIHWNPFNSNENAVFASNHISFYKGVPVFLKNSGRSGSFYIISLNKYEPVDTLKHERGHNWQAMMMGIGTFAITVGIPSSLMLGPWSSNGNYYGAP